MIPADHLEQVVTVHTNQSTDHLQGDLLTQAMSELTQTLNEYRTQSTPTSAPAAAAEYQIAQLTPVQPTNQVSFHQDTLLDCLRIQPHFKAPP